MELRIPDGEFLQYINGQQVEGASRTAAIVCPGNGEFVAKVRLASAEQAQAALEAARDAFPIWSRMSLEERGGWILKLRDAIAEEREIILMVVPTGDKNTVMQAIMAQAGAHTEAQAVTFSVALEDVAGLYHINADE